MTFPREVLPFWFAKHQESLSRVSQTSRATRQDVSPHAADHTVDDSQLIQRIQASDTTAFEHLFFVHVEGLVVFTTGYVGSRTAAEDIVADVFAAIWERRTTWAPQHGIRAYLYSSVRNRALNIVRDTASREKIIEQPSLAPDPPRPIDETLEIEEQLALIRQIIATFPEQRRRIMELRWRDGLSAAEIATVLGITRNAVDIQLTRALAVLRERLPHVLE